MGILEGARAHYSLFGFYGVYLVVKARLVRKSLEVTVAIENVSHPIHLRLRTTDVSVFGSIILHSEYECNTSKPPKVIVDAGANIGLSSIFYANRYPEARIIAIEPELANYRMLKKNATPYPNIITVQRALWKTNQEVCLSDPGVGQWGFQTRDNQQLDAQETPILVRGITLDKLMDEYGLNYIDVLKIDIEGSEKEVFDNPAPWIDRVGMIVIELHDRFKQGCSRSVYLATRDFDVEWRKGETTFFARKEYVFNGGVPPPVATHSDLTGRINGLKSRLKIVSVD